MILWGEIGINVAVKFIKSVSNTLLVRHTCNERFFTCTLLFNTRIYSYLILKHANLNNHPAVWNSIVYRKLKKCVMEKQCLLSSIIWWSSMASIASLTLMMTTIASTIQFLQWIKFFEEIFEGQFFLCTLI